MVGLLLGGAPFDERVTEHADREDVIVVPGRHARLGELLGQHRSLEHRQACAAELRRPGHGEQVVLGQDRPPPGDELGPLIGAERPHPGPVSREVLTEERLDLLAERLCGVGVGGLHRPIVPAGGSVAKLKRCESG